MQTIANVLFIVSLLLLVYVLLVHGVGVGRVLLPRPGDLKALDNESANDYKQITEKQHGSIKNTTRIIPFWLAIIGLLISVTISII